MRCVFDSGVPLGMLLHPRIVCLNTLTPEHIDLWPQNYIFMEVGTGVLGISEVLTAPINQTADLVIRASVPGELLGGRATVSKPPGDTQGLIIRMK